ncbi:MAG: beta-Ala-His dipeptidase [Mycoplasmataceae bacterium]|jgi:dipeptidase D|nr:beta-Ala-His dipeptidase [Mycoplasmataceae bacterium]
MTQNLILKYFSEICQIPHVSGNEKGVIDYIVNILKQYKIVYKVDKVGNIYIKHIVNNKKPSILLQAHMDMVGVKTENSKHNFSKDPIAYYEDNGFIRAKETSLGADDGIGVAMILAILTDDNTKNFNLEALLTVEEETTFKGVQNLLPKYFESKYLINLDSEEDYFITIGSAGSGTGIIKYNTKPKLTSDKKYTISVNGNLGGHSGVQIHEIRMNIIVEIFNVLKNINDNVEFVLTNHIDGGQATNAIPSNIKFSISTKDINKFKKEFDKEFKNLKNAFVNDNNVNYTIIENKDKNIKQLSVVDTTKIINIVNALYSGMKYYDFKISSTLSSTNVGIINFNNNTLTVKSMFRSSNMYLMKDFKNHVQAIANLANANFEIDEIVPGLDPMVNNPLAEKIQNIANKKFKHKMDIVSVHAGLEMSDILKKYPNMIPASIGPNTYDVHSVNENVEIKSIFFIYDLLKAIFEEI